MLELLSSAGNILVVIMAFSVLIFVHELGHFLAAIIVGVRPERFFIGFDVYGLGIKKTYKGCVYGIGLLPLGGYVKLAGQSDDPRAQKKGRGEKWEFYSKPLWAQAFILVAGVLMNMGFGFCILLFMYLYGMPNIPAIVGGTVENSSAYYSGIQAGDKLLKIDDYPLTNFNKLREYVALNASKKSTRVFKLAVERDGKISVHQVTGQANPEAAGLVMLGIEPPSTTIIGRIEMSRPLGKDYEKLLQLDDQIIAIDNQRLDNPNIDGHLLAKIIGQNAGKMVTATILRSGENGDEKINVTLPIAGIGTYDFGYHVCVEIGDVIAGYPAEKAGLRAGEKIIGVVIDGREQKILTRAQLSALIRARAYQPVNLTVMREGKKITLDAPTFCSIGDPRIALGQDNFLGVIVDENIKVTQILTNENHRESLLQLGDMITEINGEKFTELNSAVAKAMCKEVDLKIAGREKTVTVKPQIDRENGVPLAGLILNSMAMVYQVMPQTPAEKFLSPGDYVLETVLMPNGKTTVYWANANQKAQKPITFNTPNNINVNEITTLIGALPAVDFLMTQVRHREALPQALSLAFNDSIDLSLTVYKLLHRLATRNISTEAMTGPLGIIRFMSTTLKARDPLMELLKLLALISINLAIFNLLPFPVLDGGHLAFIGIEAIKGSPPSERLREVTQYFGVACLLVLMIYVSFNDISRWAKDMKNSALTEYEK